MVTNMATSWHFRTGVETIRAFRVNPLNLRVHPANIVFNARMSRHTSLPSQSLTLSTPPPPEEDMKSILASLTFVVLGSGLQAADWPAWRGPTGQGFCDEKNLPLKWSDKENVKWKVPLANQGNSTPVVSGDKIFLTQANKGGSERSLMCLARADGKVLWKKDVAYVEKERNYNESWYCNASPAIGGERVVVSFASAGMYCFDFDGKELWKRTDLGKWEHQFGNGASPVLYGDLVIMWCGPNANSKDRNFLLAVEKATGKTVWEHDEKFGSWGTPLIAKIDGMDQLLLSTSNDVKGAPDERTGQLMGLDPKTGKVLWFCRGLDSFNYTSPLYSNGIAVGMSGFGGSALAVKLGGTGDITKDRLWKHPKPANQRVGSGMIVGDHVYMVEENGQPHCYDLKTGEEVWKAEGRAGVTWGSMVHAEGRFYVLMRNGQTLVMAAKPKYELLATNSLGRDEQTNSSLAISNGDIFIRTFKHLWCIGEKSR
jgi:outer membrane protein assembly factor BamB